MTRTNTMIRSALILLAAVGGPAQDLGYPELGYVFDPRSGAILRVSGLPGAALAQPVDIPDLRLAELAICNERKYGLGIAEPARDVVAIDLDRRTQPLVRRLDLDPDVQRVALSPEGKFALLYYREKGTVCTLRGLPEAPELDRCHPVYGEPAALAVSDHGAVIVASPGSGVQLLRGEGAVALPVAAGIESAAFRPGSGEAVLAAAGELYLVSGPPAAPQLRILPLPNGAPAAAEFSRDGSTVYVVYPEEGALALVDPLSAGVQTISCTAAGFRRLKGNGVFHLVETDSPVIRVFDGDASMPRVVFVPRPSGEVN